MLDGATRFEIRYLHRPLQLVVDRTRDAEARAMADHQRERHPELRTATATLDEVLDHFRVRPNRE